MGHAESLGTPEPPVSQADRIRLVDYSRQVIARDAIDTDGLEEAADGMVAAQQHALRAHEHDPLDEDAIARNIELWHTGLWAVTALRYLHGDGYAKRRQLEHSDDRPLAVCVGGGTTDRVTTILGSFDFQALGCFGIFEDSKRLSGDTIWSRQCANRRPNHGQSRRRATTIRKQQHALIAAATAACAQSLPKRPQLGRDGQADRGAETP